MTSGSRNGMLLVVERDPRFTAKLKKHLRLGELHPFFVETGKDAIFLLNTTTPGFILVNLAALSSWEEVDALREFSSAHQTPLLFIEGQRQTAAIAERLRGKGFDAIISLPFNIRSLIERMSLMVKSAFEGLEIGPEGQKVQLLSKLGSGASGTVYQARQPGLERQVAVKFLAEEHLNDQDAVQRFYREARAIAQMRSPHVVQVYFVGTHENRPYLVMELINGPTLEKFLASAAPLHACKAFRIAREILIGLVEAHSNHKVHRDLKPANVMINPKGQAVILDFGLAREAQDNITKTGMVLGTPRYISPEQVQGHAIDGRCDLYSLGIMLYEMVLGEVPFKGKDFVSILWAHVKTPLPQPHELGRELDAGAWSLIAKLAAKQPDDRFDSAEAALEAVQAWLSTQKTTMESLADTRVLDRPIQPLGGMAIDAFGSATQSFGNLPSERARTLHLIQGLVEQLGDLGGLGAFGRGILDQDNNKLLVFKAQNGLAAIETSDSHLTSRFNMIQTAELAELFRRGVS